MHLRTSLLLLTFLKVFISCGFSLTNGASPNSQNQTTCYGNQDGTKCTAFNSTHCKDHIGNYLKICTNTASMPPLMKQQNTENITYSKNNESNKVYRQKRQVLYGDQSEIFRQPQDIPKNILYKTSVPNNINLIEPSLSDFRARVQNAGLNLQDGNRVLNKMTKSYYKDTSFIPQIKGYKKVTYFIPEFEDEHITQNENNYIHFQPQPSGLQLKPPTNEPKLSADKPNKQALLKKEVTQPKQPAVLQSNILSLLQKAGNQSGQPAVYQPNSSSLLQKEVNQPLQPAFHQENLLRQKSENKAQQPAIYQPNIPSSRQREGNEPQQPTAYQPNSLWQKTVNQPQQPAVLQSNIPSLLQKEGNQSGQPAVYQPNSSSLLQKEVNQPLQPAFHQENLLRQKSENKAQQPAIYQPNIPSSRQREGNEPQQPTAYQPNSLWQKTVNQPQQPAVYQPNIPSLVQIEGNRPQQPTANQPNLHWQDFVNQPQRPAIHQSNIPSLLQIDVNRPRQPTAYQPNLLWQNLANQQQQPSAFQTKIPVRLQKEVNQPQQPAIVQPNIPVRLQKEVNQPQQPAIVQPNIPGRLQKEVNQPQQPAIVQPNIPGRLQKEVSQPQQTAVYQPNIPGRLQKDLIPPQQPPVVQPDIPGRLQKKVSQPQQTAMYQPNIPAHLQKEVNYPQQTAFYKPNIPAHLQKNVNHPQQTAIYPPNITGRPQKEVSQPNIPAHLQKEVYYPQQTAFYQPNIPAHLQKNVNHPQQTAVHQPNITAHLQKEVSQPPKNAVHQTNIPALLQKESVMPLKPSNQPNTHALPQQEINEPRQHVNEQNMHAHPETTEVNQQVITARATNIPAFPQTESVMKLQQPRLSNDQQPNKNDGITEESDSVGLFIKLCMPFKISKSKNNSNILNIQIIPSAITDGIEAEMVNSNQSSFNNDSIKNYQHSNCDVKNTEGVESNIPTENNVPTKPNEQFKDPPHVDILVDGKQSYGNSKPAPITNGQPNRFEKLIKYMYIPIESTVPSEHSKIISPNHNFQAHDRNYTPTQSERHTDFLLPAVVTKTPIPNAKIYYTDIPNRHNEVDKEKKVSAPILQPGVPHLNQNYPERMLHQTVQDLKKHTDILLPELQYDLAQVVPDYSAMYQNQAFHPPKVPYGNMNKKEEKGNGVFSPPISQGVPNLNQIYPEHMLHQTVQDPKKHTDILLPELQYDLASNDPDYSAMYQNQAFHPPKVPYGNMNKKEEKGNGVFSSPISQGVPNLNQIYPEHMLHQTVQDPKKHTDILLPELQYDLASVVPDYSAMYQNQASHQPKVPYGNMNKKEEKGKGVFAPIPQDVPNLNQIYPEHMLHHTVQDPKKHTDILLPESRYDLAQVVPDYSALYQNQASHQPKVPYGNMNKKEEKRKGVFPPIPQGVLNLNQIYPEHMLHQTVQDPKKHTDILLPEIRYDLAQVVPDYSALYQNQAFYPLETGNGRINERIPQRESGIEGVSALDPLIGAQNFHNVHSQYGTQMSPDKNVRIGLLNDFQNEKHIDIIMPETNVIENDVKPNWSQLDSHHGNGQFNTFKIPNVSGRGVFVQNPQISVPNLYGTHFRYGTYQNGFQDPKKHTDVPIPEYSSPASHPNRPYNTLEITNGNIYDRIPNAGGKDTGVFSSSPQTGIQMPDKHKGINGVSEPKHHIDILLPENGSGNQYIPKLNRLTPHDKKHINTVRTSTANTNVMSLSSDPQVNMPDWYRFDPKFDTQQPNHVEHTNAVQKPTRNTYVQEPFRERIGMKTSPHIDNMNMDKFDPYSKTQTRDMNVQMNPVKSPFRDNHPEIYKTDPQDKEIPIQSAQYNETEDPLRYRYNLGPREKGMNYDRNYQRDVKDESDSWKNLLQSSLKYQKLKDSQKLTQPTVNISNNNPGSAIQNTFMDTTNTGYPTTLQTDHKLVANQNLRAPNDAPMGASIWINKNHSTNSSNTSTSSSHSNQETNVKLTLPSTQIKYFQPSKIIQDTEAVNINEKHTLNPVPNENNISDDKKYEYGTVLNFPKVESDSKGVLPDDVNKSSIIDQSTYDFQKNYQPVVPTNNVLIGESFKPLVLRKANEMSLRSGDLMQLSHNHLKKKPELDVDAVTPAAITYAKTMHPNINYEEPLSLSNIYRQTKDEFTSDGQLLNTKPSRNDDSHHRDQIPYSNNVIIDPPWWLIKENAIIWSEPERFKEVRS